MARCDLVRHALALGGVAILLNGCGGPASDSIPGPPAARYERHSVSPLQPASLGRTRRPPTVEIGFWDYPGGGAAVKTIPIGGSSLVGVTISVAPRQ